MRCLNHPDADAEGSCMSCGNVFCGACLEEVGERRVCLDCLEAMAQSTLAVRERTFISTKTIAAGALLLLLGLAAALETALQLGGLAQSLLFQRGASPSLFSGLFGFFLGVVKMLAYFTAGYGVLMSRNWSYLVGLAVASGTLLSGIYSMLASPNPFSFILISVAVGVFTLIVFGGNWHSGALGQPEPYGRFERTANQGNLTE